MQANQTPWCVLLHDFLPTCFQISEMMAQLWSSILQPHLKRVGCDLSCILCVWLRGKGCNILNRNNHLRWGHFKFFGILEGQVPVSNRHSLLQTHKTGWKAMVFTGKTSSVKWPFSSQLLFASPSVKQIIDTSWRSRVLSITRVLYFPVMSLCLEVTSPQLSTYGSCPKPRNILRVVTHLAEILVAPS